MIPKSEKLVKEESKVVKSEPLQVKVEKADQNDDYMPWTPLNEHVIIKRSKKLSDIHLPNDSGFLSEGIVLAIADMSSPSVQVGDLVQFLNRTITHIFDDQQFVMINIKSLLCKLRK